MKSTYSTNTHKNHVLSPVLVYHTTAMCFTLNIASPLLYTCRFTQRPKASVGKGVESPLKRQGDAAFVSEWALKGEVTVTRGVWEYIQVLQRAQPITTVSHIHTYVSFPLPLISCAVNDAWVLHIKASACCCETASLQDDTAVLHFQKKEEMLLNFLLEC